MSYSLADDPLMSPGTGSKVLMKDNRVVNCPFHPPITMQGKLAHQVSLQYRACGTWCALFHDGYMHNVKKGVIQACSIGNILTIDTEKAPETTPENPSGLKLLE